MNLKEIEKDLKKLIVKCENFIDTKNKELEEALEDDDHTYTKESLKINEEINHLNSVVIFLKNTDLVLKEIFKNKT